MTGVAEALARCALFREADPRELRATAPRWAERPLAAGEMLWYESDPATEIALVLEGELEVMVAGQPISRVAPGEIVGEAAAFVAGELRTAALRARTAARLLVLPQAGLTALRRDHTSVYDVLLGRALGVLAERIEATLARISEDAAAGHWPPGVDGGAQRMTRVRPAVRDEPPPSARPALRLLPLLRAAPDPILSAIERAMTPEPVAEGDALLVEGDPGDRLYLLADGRLEVFRQIPALRGLRLATLRAGALVGTGGLLLGRPRNASCIAARDSWAYALDARAFRALGGEAGRLFREALLCALRSQLRSVGTRLARFEAARAERPRTDPPLDDFLGAAGGALAYQAAFALEPVSPAALPFRDEVEAKTPHARRLVDTIRASVIGADEAIETPYGWMRVTYADHADSGRCLGFLEDFIREEVMPVYASPQSEHSGTARHTTRYREDARELVRQCVGATREDAVIFCGSGATAAINKLVDILNLRLPADLGRAYSLEGHIPIHRRPVVFIGPYEHHSNELPWRHSLAEVVVIDDDDDGRIDLGKLEDALNRYATRPIKIGSFSAASNVTGIVSDVRAVSILLHRHGALSFWDYGAAAPHTPVQMNLADGPDGHLAYKDAVFLSPHKLVGGPGSPGVLVVKKNLVRNSIPTQPGSGTVVLVTPESVVYRQSPERREEAGTPAVLESIRAGLAFGLERAVGHEVIGEMERGFVQRAMAAWQQNPNFRLLGSPTADRLAIVPFMVRYGRRYLHNNFVVALLNDLFGIQARGGCSCAGPYMHRLLGIGAELSREVLALVERGFASITPGWTRVGFNYFGSNAEFRYVVAAVDLVARYGHLLLPDYGMDLATGQWRHATGEPSPARGLGELSYASGKLEYPSRHLRLPEQALADQLEAAMRIFERAQDAAGSPPRAVSPPREGEYERLRWFAMPEEVAHDLGLASR